MISDQCFFEKWLYDARKTEANYIVRLTNSKTYPILIFFYV